MNHCPSELSPRGTAGRWVDEAGWPGDHPWSKDDSNPSLFLASTMP